MGLILVTLGFACMAFGAWAALHDMFSNDRRWVPLWLALVALPGLVAYLMEGCRWAS
jgi:hypothetical protein